MYYSHFAQNVDFSSFCNIPVLFVVQAIENGRNLIALSCSIKLVNAIVSAEKRETPITDVSKLKLRNVVIDVIKRMLRVCTCMSIFLSINVPNRMHLEQIFVSYPPARELRDTML